MTAEGIGTKSSAEGQVGRERVDEDDLEPFTDGVHRTSLRGLQLNHGRQDVFLRPANTCTGDQQGI